MTNINYCQVDYEVKYKTGRVHPYSFKTIIIGDTIEEAKKYKAWQRLEKTMLDRAYNFRSQKVSVAVKKMKILAPMGEILYDPYIN